MKGIRMNHEIEQMEKKVKFSVKYRYLRSCLNYNAQCYRCECLILATRFGINYFYYDYYYYDFIGEQSIFLNSMTNGFVSKEQ